MNTLLSSLAEICRQYKFTSKLLLVNSYQAGHHLLEALAQYSVPWLNITPVTPAELALQAAAQAIEENNLKMISDGQTLLFIDEVLDELDTRKELKYFSELKNNAGLAAILKNSLMELRIAGLSSENINPDDFVDKQKGREIKLLLEGYEKRLQSHNLLDTASLYVKAMDKLDRSTLPGQENETLYIIPEQLELGFLSFAFLERLTESQRLVIPAEPVGGHFRPDGFYFRSDQSHEKETIFSWLYNVENAPSDRNDDDIEIFQAYGTSSEIREVFRLLKKDRIPADTAMLCYTSGETYLPLVYSLSQAYNIPVTFGEGIPVGFTRPGRLLFGLLDWIEENHAVSSFYRLFTEGIFKASAPMILSRLLRRAGIGWGRERYLPALEALEQSFKANLTKAETEEQEPNSAYLQKRQEQLQDLKEIVTFILDKLPIPDDQGCINFEKLCNGLSEIMQQYARDKDALDKGAVVAIIEQLSEASQSIREDITIRQAAQRLKAWLETMRIGASSFEPGHLHVTSFSKGEWFHRPHTFLIGLDDGHFPGSGLQDPVLLDQERAAISRNLRLRSTAPTENTYRLNRFLASRRGRITLSFAAYNPVEGRTSFPAAALLQVYRLKTGDPGADYSQFMNSLPKPAAFFPEQSQNALSEEEWWASLVLHHGKIGDLDRVRNCYPHLHKGMHAEETRSGEYFTNYDGNIAADPAELDPRLNGRTLSATRIEALAACPFAYFLRHILKVEPPDEQVFDPGKWLDPPTRGLLLHQIYATYLRKTSTGSTVNLTDRDYLVETAEELILETKKQIPPPSPVVYEYEKKELLQGLEVFLRVEEELRRDGSFPFYLEVPFGLGAEETMLAGLGLDEPVEVELPGGGTVYLRGRIDRIDRISPEEPVFRVWDFKTGSTYGYDELKYIKQGQQIQHCLYGLAAETFLQNKEPGARIDEAGYIFPTEKGEGERFLRQQHRRREALLALQNMLDLLAAGVFCATQDQGRCTYCEYQTACRYPSSVEYIKKKLLYTGNTELAPWKELQQYD